MAVHPAYVQFFANLGSIFLNDPLHRRRWRTGHYNCWQRHRVATTQVRAMRSGARTREKGKGCRMQRIAMAHLALDGFFNLLHSPKMLFEQGQISFCLQTFLLRWSVNSIKPQWSFGTKLVLMQKPQGNSKTISVLIRNWSVTEGLGLRQWWIAFSSCDKIFIIYKQPRIGPKPQRPKTTDNYG